MLKGVCFIPKVVACLHENHCVIFVACDFKVLFINMGLTLIWGRFVCVDEFKYLGYTINSFLTPKCHIVQKKDSMFAAERSMGSLLKILQGTNIKSIRSYFHALVASQLYGLECFNFNHEDFYKAAKLFSSIKFLSSGLISNKFGL
jgi:hypothetical protein